MHGPLKERTRTKLAKATMIAPASIHINKTNIKIRCNRMYIAFEAIVFVDTINTLTTGLRQVT